ncbi:hypothetical protein [Pseudomonas umsongensis]|uniref:hypothetical protein n=1 Tax=Pseudomonas umsongensis TaxID=198618 RepID=UPI003D7F1B4E
MNFDNDSLQYLRNECEIHQIDFKRARLKKTAGDGLEIHLDPALFDLDPILTGVPSSIPVRSAAAAEGEMCQWLLKIQRAERQRARLGVKVGWDNCAINRVPLTDEEITECRARIKKAKDMERLQRELTDVLETTAKNAAVKKAHDELEQRYGLIAHKPAEQKCQPALNAPKRKPVSRNAK